MEVVDGLLYTKSHEWTRLEGETATIGITDFAQHQLSDVTFVELPDIGDSVSAQDEVAVVESVKAASDIYAPLSGTIIEVNEALNEQPEAINNSPFENGWLFKLKVSDMEEIKSLMSAEGYRETLPSE